MTMFGQLETMNKQRQQSFAMLTPFVETAIQFSLLGAPYESSALTKTLEAIVG